MGKTIKEGIVEFIKEQIGIDSEMKVQNISELIDGSLNVTVNSDDPELDDKCYYIYWENFYKINRKVYEYNIQSKPESI